MKEDFYCRANKLNDRNIVYGLLTYHNNEICIITRDNNKYFIKEKTIQKCTGLKDVNNNFIYVGDILKHNEGKDFVVEFHYLKGIILSEINGTSEHLIGIIYWTDECEIIGNIYETPELLNK